MSAGGEEAAIRFNGVSKTLEAGAGSCRARIRVLRHVSIEIPHGAVSWVTGGAGAGKTVFLLCAAGLMRPDDGEIRWSSRAREATARRYCALRDFAARATPWPRSDAPPALLCVDDADVRPEDRSASLALRRLAALRARGTSLLLAAHAAPRPPAYGASTFLLRGGRIVASRVRRVEAPFTSAALSVGRVAERARLR